MKNVLVWVGTVLISLAVLALVGAGAIWYLSERELDRTYPVPDVALSVPRDRSSIAEGRRLATIRGCYAGCHGKTLEGGVMFDDPKIARITTPNLTASVRRYDDAQLAVAIRNGLWPDGRSMIVMPSEAFVELTDEDVGRIIAFLRSVPPVEGPTARVEPGPLGRLGLVAGQFKTAARLIREAPPLPPGEDAQAQQGRYLARTVCGECHGAHLRGSSTPDYRAPSLETVAAYSQGEFARMLRTGKAPGDRELPFMGPRARQHLRFLTEAEIDALYAYLRKLPAAEIR